MLLTEELGAEAVWVINNGVSHWQDVPTDQIAPWVDSALESIEFVTGGFGPGPGPGPGPGAGTLQGYCLLQRCMPLQPAAE